MHLCRHHNKQADTVLFWNTIFSCTPILPNYRAFYMTKKVYYCTYMHLLVFYRKQNGTNQVMIRTKFSVKLKTNSTAELKHASLMILRKGCNIISLKNSNKERLFQSLSSCHCCHSPPVAASIIPTDYSIDL